MNQLLPQTVSKRLAAILSGRSNKAFSVFAPYIEDEGGRIPLAAVEHLNGAEITVEAYLAGQRRLDVRRQHEREKQIAKRAALVAAHNKEIDDRRGQEPEAPGDGRSEENAR